LLGFVEGFGRVEVFELDHNRKPPQIALAMIRTGVSHQDRSAVLLDCRTRHGLEFLKLLGVGDSDVSNEVALGHCVTSLSLRPDPAYVDRVSDFTEKVKSLSEAAVLQTGDALERVALASAVDATLEGIGDTMLSDFVKRARGDGSTWGQIGERLHSTRQAAQARFGRSDNKPESKGNRMNKDTRDWKFRDAYEQLTGGPTKRLEDVPRATGGHAGVATIFIAQALT